MARQLDELRRHPDDFLTLLPPASGPIPEWLRLLPLHVSTSSLFVIERAEVVEIRREVESAPVLARERVAGEELIRSRILGWETWVLGVGATTPADETGASLPQPPPSLASSGDGARSTRLEASKLKPEEKS